MKFRLEKEEESIVEVWLEIQGKDVILMVGRNRDDSWDIIKLQQNGKLARCEGIDEDNVEGLQVDNKGRIKLDE